MAQKKSNKNKGKPREISSRSLVKKGDLQEYAKIIKLLGGSFIVVFIDNSETQVSIPGRFRKKCYMSIGDVILVSKREYENKYDIIVKYTISEIKALLILDEIPEFFAEAEACNENEVSGIVFDNDEPEDKEINIIAI
jgi:initiation factor 1A